MCRSRYGGGVRGPLRTPPRRATTCDGFGTGHSSLTNLRRFPGDLLKIERSFVSGLASDLQDHALVAAAIDLARTFGLLTVAEEIAVLVGAGRPTCG
jgi:predicted signal transduction protein with EAL and GGDEF domain